MRGSYFQVTLFSCFFISSARHSIYDKNYFPSVQVIQQFVSQSPSDYIVNFEARDEFIHKNYHYVHYASCVRCTFVFSLPYETYLKKILHLFQTRYKLTFNIILTPIYPANLAFEVYYTEKYIMLPTTIYFVYS